jgi:hypothetical protein
MTDVVLLPTHKPPFAGDGDAASAVGEAAAQAAGISLDEVLVRAELQTRLDRKYVGAADDFASLAAGFAGELEVLEIDGRGGFAYE